MIFKVGEMLALGAEANMANFTTVREPKSCVQIQQKFLHLETLFLDGSGGYLILFHTQQAIDIEGEA
jgi:hypothetical protein